MPKRNSQSYEGLIFEIFGEKRPCITETEFCEKLPDLLREVRPTGIVFKWTERDYAEMVMTYYGLFGRAPKSLKEVGAFHGISGSTARMHLDHARRLLQRPDVLLKIAKYPTVQEINAAHKELTEAWSRALRSELRGELMKTVGLNERRCRELFSRSFDPGGSHLRFTFRGYCSIREALGLPAVTLTGREKPKRPVSQNRIDDAVNLLTSLGYRIEEPNT